MASLASSVGGGGQVREGVLAGGSEAAGLGGSWYPGQPGPGAGGHFHLALEGGEEQGGPQPRCPADLLLSVTPLPGGQGRQERADFLTPGPLECVSNTSHGAL